MFWCNCICAFMILELLNGNRKIDILPNANHSEKNRVKYAICSIWSALWLDILLLLNILIIRPLFLGATRWTRVI